MKPFDPTDYKTKKESIVIEEIRFELLRITNIDELYDKLIQKGKDHEAVKDERIPYWCDLWPSAIALSKHMLKFNLVKKESSVLEIGCGLGLPGIVAGKSGARVTLTDYLPEAIEFAKQNWMLNNKQQADFDLLDWRNPAPAIKADILLASDVAYEKRSYEYLLKSFKTLIHTNGLILMSEPNRAYTKVFFDSLHMQGFKFSTTSYTIPK